MAKKMDWRRAAKPRPREEKYAPGTVLRRTGRVVRALAPRDDLEANAEDALRRWRQRMGLDENLQRKGRA